MLLYMYVSEVCYTSLLSMFTVSYITSFYWILTRNLMHAVT